MDKTDGIAPAMPGADGIAPLTAGAGGAADIIAQCWLAKEKSKIIVFTNGCFDELHEGHKHLLREAKKQGDILVVGVNGDKSISLVKGKWPRSLLLRIQELESIPEIDYVIPFDTLTPLELIAWLRPNVLVKGSDWEEQVIVGQEYADRVCSVPILRDKNGKKISSSDK